MTRLLTADEFRATFAAPPVPISPDEAPAVDFWPYFDAISTEDFAGHDCSDGEVEHVWRMADGRHEHVLVNTEDRNVFLVLVLDLIEQQVVGHRLLDLNQEYQV
jgi:hypothetical protein